MLDSDKVSIYYMFINFTWWQRADKLWNLRGKRDGGDLHPHLDHVLAMAWYGSLVAAAAEAVEAALAGLVAAEAAAQCKQACI